MNETRLDSAINSYCRENLISGTVRVARSGRILFERSYGYADHEQRIPFAPGSLYTLYSLSKPFCAMCLLLLADRRKVDLDAHPGKYVPEAAGFDPRVTLQQLLRHESGLPDFLQTEAFSRKRPQPGDLRRDLLALTEYESFFAPGTGCRYCNVNYNLLALIIENVSGLPYAEYLHREVLLPLGMEHTFADNGTLSLSGEVRGTELANGRRINVPRATDYMFGAGDLVSTLDDVYALYYAYHDRPLLRPETWETAVTPSPIAGFGMGCFPSEFHGKKRIGHSGGHTGFRNLHFLLPEDETDVILLFNSGYGSAREDISELIYKELYV